MKGHLRIIVLGYIVRGPLGGMAWHHLQYVLGFARLGHDVYFIEDSDDYPSCYDPQRHITDTDPSYGLEFIKRAFDRIGMQHCWAYYDAHTVQWYGPCARAIPRICETADVLFNVSGVNPLRPWLMRILHRVLVDTDPVFTQVRHLTDTNALALARRHTAFFSFAESIASRRCLIPNDGFPWIPTRQPIVLDAWKPSPANPKGSYTTVMQWESYSDAEYQGQHFGTKSTSFGPFLDLPSKVQVTLELALGGEKAPRRLLRKRGWRIRDPIKVTSSLDSYQRYLCESKAEFSVAKQAYVCSNSGWFSERSACYLATGRPVIVQDTGFTSRIETGRGVLVFNSLEQACASIEELEVNYTLHYSAARELVHHYFDAAAVLSEMIDAIFANSQPNLGCQ